MYSGWPDLFKSPIHATFHAAKYRPTEFGSSGNSLFVQFSYVTEFSDHLILSIYLLFISEEGHNFYAYNMLKYIKS